MGIDIEVVLLVAASVVSLVWWVPQLVGVVRHGSVGVSSETWTIAAANLTLWGWWALVAGQPVVAAVEWVQAAGSIAVVTKIGVTRRAVVLTGTVVAVVLMTQVWAPAASVAAVGSVALVRAPQLVEAIQDRANGVATQVSRVTWLMSGVSNLLWLGWGVAGGHAAMIVGAGLSVVLSTAIAIVVDHRHAG